MLLVSTIILCSLASSYVHGEQPTDNHWLGTRVVQKYDNFPLRVDDKPVVRSGTLTPIYCVKRTDGNRFWLEAEDFGVKGWCSRDQVVPVEQAIQFFTEAVRTQPDDTFPYIMRSLIWSDRRDYTHALADLDEPIRRRQDSPVALNNRAHLHYFLKEFDKAIDDCTKAISLAPRFAGAYSMRARAVLAKKDYEKALDDYDRAIEIEGGPIPYCVRGLVRLEKKEYNLAIADLSKSIQLDLDYAEAFYVRGMTYVRMKHIDNAIRDLTESVRLAPSDPRAYRGRSAAWRLKGEYKRATEYDSKVLELQRNDRARTNP